MYRARVEAVSGTKVLAGGKWLQCIGNKPVRVGEHIWTDGRCVYGNYQESQQPLVITAPDEEAIPIIAVVYGEMAGLPEWTAPHHIALYTFSGSKLKLLKEMPYNQGNEYGMMVHDFKGNVFYSASRPSDEDRQLLATNIDKRGDRYDMILRTETYIDGGDKFIKGYTIEIVKNGEILQTSFAEVTPYCCFIENEDNWRYCFHRLTEYSQSGTDTTTETEYVLRTNTSTQILEYRRSTYHHSAPWPSFNDYYSSFTSTVIDATSAKFLLHDGYYYQMDTEKKTLTLGDLIYNDEIAGIPATWLGDAMPTYWYNFFTPKGELIYSTNPLDKLGFANRIFLLRRLRKGGYLLCSNEDTVTGGAGITLIKNGKAQYLLDVGLAYCLNQNLLPIKRYKNWQNRIQELTIK